MNQCCQSSLRWSQSPDGSIQPSKLCVPYITTSGPCFPTFVSLFLTWQSAVALKPPPHLRRYVLRLLHLNLVTRPDGTCHSSALDDTLHYYSDNKEPVSCLCDVLKSNTGSCDQQCKANNQMCDLVSNYVAGSSPQNYKTNSVMLLRAVFESRKGVVACTTFEILSTEHCSL